MKSAPFALAAFLVLMITPYAAGAAAAQQEAQPPVPGGQLQILGKDGAISGSCPLKHTDVTADITSFVARVKVRQTFHNTSPEKVEAVYVFPLPDDAAVDHMVMTIGERRVVGQVKEREEARRVYERAREAAHVAALLDQERPNVFTQAVANIEPGAQVDIEIGYVETLKYQDGSYEFAFPTVVGPRYVPGSPTGKQGDGFAPDTTEVPDASKVTPAVTPPGTRAGHDISLTVNVDAGMEINELECRTHPVNVDNAAPGRAKVTLKRQKELPNKDFVLRYRTAGEQVADAFLAHRDERGHFFTLVLQPPARVERKEAVPRELIFVLDTSGSMRGFPIEKAKWVMGEAINGMGEKDTFNLITFSGDTHVLWEQLRPNTDENRKEALLFLASREGRGGTEMMAAIEAALARPGAAKPQAAGGGAEPIRVVCFMTDGFVGNDLAIIDAVKKHAATTRVFSFGIGNSVNRFLLDGMAIAGRGEVEYVLLESMGDAAAKRFHERISAPVLTDVSIDWGDVPAADVYPKPGMIPDLFSAKPVVVHGRLTGDVKEGATVTLRGNTAAGPFERQVAVKTAPADASHEALASLWARAKAEELMMRDMAALQVGAFPEVLTKELTALGIEFRLMTQFTSFVAVEELTVTKGGKPVKVAVPVEMPEGVSYEGVFGENDGLDGGIATRGGRRSGFNWATIRSPNSTLAVRGTSVRLYDKPPFKSEKKAERFKDVTNASKLPAVAQQQAAQQAGDDSETETVPEAVPDPESKLHPSLRELAAKVEAEGKDGSLTVNGVAVADWKVDVLVLFRGDRTPELAEALKALGFDENAKVNNTRAAAGTIDVRKLAELAGLDAVIEVRPLAG